MNHPISMLISRKGSTVHTVAPGTSVCDAVELMNAKRIGSVVVLEADRIAGIFTERDVLDRVVAAGRDPRRTPVAEVMSTPVRAIEPTTSVQEAMELFTTLRCRHLPAVEGGHLVGLLSIGDVVFWLLEHHREEANQLRSYITGDPA
jgi:CBS domain-containing protein